ncbi:MAG: ABC transporter substrate-binding protein [Bacteroidales bacterium]|nr:ABC transporter substrate-binding protein [Bacteroidales bacterium]
MTSFRPLTILSFCLAAVSLHAQDTFVFTPQWSAQAQFAGYYVALEKGFYEEEGVSVEIVHPSTSQTAMDRVRTEKSHATTLQLAQAMEIVDSGFPLVNVLQTSMNNALMIVSRWEKNPLEQHGAHVGIWNTGFTQLGYCMNQKEGMDYQWVRFVNNLNLFVSGALDATMAMSYNEYYLLLQAGMDLKEEYIYRFSDHGYNIQEDGVYMPLKTYRANKDRAERFVRASRRGWEWTAEHPEEALDIVMHFVEKNQTPTNRVMQKLMLEEILRQQVDRDSHQREFRLREDMVEQASSLMLECGLLKRNVSYLDLMPR